MSLVSRAIIAFEAAPLPDFVRKGAVSFLVERVRRELKHTPADASRKFAEDMSNHPIATHTVDANKQHYEVPAEFFALCLGPKFKYSSCLYEDRRHARARRNPRAGRNLRQRATRRRPAHPRTRLRLGLDDAVHGGALSQRPHHRRVQLGQPARTHRGQRTRARASPTSASSPPT